MAGGLCGLVFLIFVQRSAFAQEISEPEPRCLSDKKNYELLDTLRQTLKQLFKYNEKQHSLGNEMTRLRREIKILQAQLYVQKRKDTLCTLRPQGGYDNYTEVFCNMETWMNTSLTNAAGYSLVNSSAPSDPVMSYSANFSIDGRVVNETNGTKCFLTEQEDSPWLIFDLQQTSDIVFLVLVNRQDGSGEELHDVHVKIGLDDTTFDKTCGVFKGPGQTGKVIVIPCERATGRYVKVQIIDKSTSRNRLGLCEVSIYAMN